MNKNSRNLTVEIKCPKHECRTQKQALHLARRRERRTLLGTIIAAVNGSALRRSGVRANRRGGAAMEHSLAKSRPLGPVRQHKEQLTARLEPAGLTIRKHRAGPDGNIYKTARKGRGGIENLRKRKVVKSASLYRQEA